jgi:hypothetical protein
LRAHTFGENGERERVRNDTRRERDDERSEKTDKREDVDVLLLVEGSGEKARARALVARLFFFVDDDEELFCFNFRGFVVATDDDRRRRALKRWTTERKNDDDDEEFSSSLRAVVVVVVVVSRRFVFVFFFFGEFFVEVRSVESAKLEASVQSNTDRKRPKLLHRRAHRPREIDFSGQVDGILLGDRKEEEE